MREAEPELRKNPVDGFRMFPDKVRLYECSATPSG